MTGKPIPIRLDDDLLDRIDRVIDAMVERTAGAKVPRSSVLRLALERGLDSLESELGLNRRKKR